jgi:hypothetical protein
MAVSSNESPILQVHETQNPESPPATGGDSPIPLRKDDCHFPKPPPSAEVWYFHPGRTWPYRRLSITGNAGKRKERFRDGIVEEKAYPVNRSGKDVPDCNLAAIR